jgi:hypothetical protein
MESSSQEDLSHVAHVLEAKEKQGCATLTVENCSGLDQPTAELISIEK